MPSGNASEPSQAATPNAEDSNRDEEGARTGGTGVGSSEPADADDV